MEYKIYHTIETAPKSKIKIDERGKIDTPNSQIHDRSFQKILFKFRAQRVLILGINTRC
jgi:hypothetical protein